MPIGTVRASVRRLSGSAIAAVLIAVAAGSPARAAERPVTIGHSTYTVANPAFAGIIQGMKAEAEKFGYKSNKDQGEAIETALINGTVLKRAGQPIETAYAALFLASDEASYVTGTSLVVDGGYLAP